MYLYNMARSGRANVGAIGAALCVLALATPFHRATAATATSGALRADVLSASARNVHAAVYLHAQAITDMVQVSFGLPYRNQIKLNELLQRVYDPKDPMYGHYIIGDEFDRQFAPTQADYDAVMQFALNHGMTIVKTHTGRTLLTVKGSVAAVQDAFHVQMGVYQKRDGTVVHASNVCASLPAVIARKVSAIVGLDDAGLMARPNVVRQKADPFDIAKPFAGTGPAGGLAPSDIRTAYNLTSSTLLGQSQSLALYELDGYVQSDIDSYTTQFGIPAAPLSNVLVDGYSGVAGGNTDEVVLDIDMMEALCPNIKKIYVYEAQNGTSGQDDEYVQIADDYATTNASAVSSSWGLDETADPGSNSADDAAFQKMAMQGQSMFAAAGDTGAYSPGTSTVVVGYPASDPYVTGVGGTSLTTQGAGGAYVSETVWFNSPAPNAEGGGGGSSVIYSKPGYQNGFGASKTMRDVPDVSLDADPSTAYDIFVGADGGWFTVGGTSAASPLWAALTGLVNEQRTINGITSTLGQANTPIYALASGANYGKTFHDITTGTNGAFSAGVGYDDATGWGSFIGDRLIAALSSGTPNLPQGALVGKVTDASNNPISGVVIKAVTTGTGIVVGQTTSAADGTYTLTLGVGPSYTVTADAAGYAGRSVSGIVVVASPATTTLNFSLLDLGHVFPSASLMMISAPYDYSSVADFATLFGLVEPLTATDPKLYAWQASINDYVSTPEAPADTFRLGQGYWARFPGGTNWYIHREGISAPSDRPFNIALQAGWNQIGDPFLSNIPISGLLVTGPNMISGTTATSAPIAGSPLIQSSLYAYSGTTSGYQTLAATDSLQPWQGYWIKASQAATLIVPNPPIPVTHPSH